MCCVLTILSAEGEVGKLHCRQDFFFRDGLGLELELRLNLFLDSSMARDSFATFIPISAESEARSNIIFDYFDLLSAIAAVRLAP